MSVRVRVGEEGRGDGLWRWGWGVLGFFFGKGGGVEEGVKGVCDGGCVEAILFRSFFGSSVVLRYAVPWDFSGIFFRRGKISILTSAACLFSMEGVFCSGIFAGEWLGV